MRSLQDGRQQPGRRRFAGGARHAHEAYRFHGGGQGGAQLLRRGKALGEGGKILICLFNGHSV